MTNEVVPCKGQMDVLLSESSDHCFVGSKVVQKVATYFLFFLSMRSGKWYLVVAGQAMGDGRWLTLNQAPHEYARLDLLLGKW